MKSASKKSAPLFILMINMFIAMLGIGIIIPILPQFLEGFGQGGKAGGYLIAAFGLTQFLLSPLAGDWSDKYGRKIMIIAGLAAFTASQLLFAVADQLWLLYLSRLLGGAGAAAMIPSMMAYVADITTEDERGKGMGLLGAAMSLGFVIGPGIGGFLADFGLRAPFFVSAAVAGVSMLASIALLPETLSLENRLAAKSRAGKRESIIGQMMKSFKAPYFILLLLIFSLTFGLSHFEAIFGFYVTDKYSFTEKDIAILITVGALIGAVVQAVLIQRLITRFGERKLINYTFLLSAITLIMLLFFGGFWAVLLLTSLFFTFTSVMRPAINTLLSKMAGNEQGFVAGMNNVYMSLGNIVGPALAGVLYEVEYNLPYSFGAAILIISLGISIAWNRRSPQGVQPARESN
ncbi:MFS transporter [Paenibacillaceae bacterium]|nr:MFS transporter [Paenibacillaceae bacterium]